MSRRWLTILIAVLCLPNATACSPQILANKAVEYNEVAAQAADTQLLLNVIRAAYRNPTRYSSISQLRDARTSEGGGMLSAELPFGADALRAFPFTPSVSARHSQSPSFDVIPLDTRTAAIGLFRPVEAQTFVTYWQQGWPKNVLLSLFVDTITLNAAARRLCQLPDYFDTVDNAAFKSHIFDNAQRVFDCLRDKLKMIEATEIDAPVTGATLSPEEVMKALPSLIKEGYKVRESGPVGARVYSVSKKTKSWNPVLMVGAQPIGKVELSANSAAVPVADSQAAKIGLTFRSVDGMVYYLGEIVRRQVLDGQPVRPVRYGPDGGYADLFRVDVNSAANPDMVIEVPFLNGRYAIGRFPTDGDASLTTLALISQLFSQYREGSDLPKTSAVQLIGGPLP